jgi:malonyl-CoA O-methyltransferase
VTRPDPPARIDQRRARRAFEAAAATCDGADCLQREVGERLLERLDLVRIEPARILDVGAGTGACTRALARRYPRARVLGLDFARPMLSVARSRAPRFFSRQAFVCADAEALPLAPRTFDLVLSNATLQWCNDPAVPLREFARVLVPGGLALFSTFGPDTLAELRSAWTQIDRASHVHPFLDMHDIGDALLRAGLSEVVMETERITVEYPDFATLTGDLKRLGATNAAAGRPTGLTGPRRLARVAAAYEARRRPGGGLPATWEVVYGHGWSPRTSGISVAPPRPGAAR